MNSTDIEFNGEHYNPANMTPAQLDELWGQVVDWWSAQRDLYERGLYTRKELNRIDEYCRYRKAEIKQAIAVKEAQEKQRQLAKWQALHMPAANVPVIEAMEANSYQLMHYLSTYLETEGYFLSNFDTARGNRISSGWELAMQGRWQVPSQPGGVWLVDSQAEVGSHKHQVTTKLSRHEADSCTCEDAAYHCQRYGVVCKHVIAVVLAEFARQLVPAQMPEIAKVA